MKVTNHHSLGSDLSEMSAAKRARTGRSLEVLSSHAVVVVKAAAAQVKSFLGFVPLEARRCYLTGVALMNDSVSKRRPVLRAFRHLLMADRVACVSFCR